MNAVGVPVACPKCCTSDDVWMEAARELRGLVTIGFRCKCGALFYYQFHQVGKSVFKVQTS